MAVVRIVPDLECADPERSARFYEELFGLSKAMDFDWIKTLAAPAEQPLQLNLASQGGAGAPVPALSIEVDNLDATHATAVQMDAKFVYPMTLEAWGVRRFFVSDPDGNLINILSHEAPSARSVS